MRHVRAFIATARLAAATRLEGNPVRVLLGYGWRFARVAVLLSVWRLILGGNDFGPMTLGAVLTYTLIANAFADQLDARTDLADALWEGSLAGRFLQPTGLVAHYAASTLGSWSVGLALCAAPLLGVRAAPADFGAGAFFLVSLGLSVTIGLALEFIFAALVVTLNTHIWIVSGLRSAVGVLLSGAMIPLVLLPWGLGEVFQWLPFASMASAPLRIYTGTGEPAPLLLVQAGWAIVLWPFASWIWRANRERLAFHGG